MTKHSMLQILRRMAVTAIALFTFAMLTPSVERSGQAAAQTPPAVQMETKSPRKSFLAAFDEFRKQIDEASKGVEDAAGIIKETSKITIDSKRADVSGLRDKLLGLSKQLENEGALAHAIDQFDSWIVAQRKRIDVRRGELGSQQKVEELLKIYEQFGNDVSRAREVMDAYKKDIVRLLQELAAGEALASEYLLADEAAKARDALNAALANVRATIEDFRTKLHDFGLNGPSM
jgi:uncharacterized coiled-coil DUF342 family protein